MKKRSILLMAGHGENVDGTWDPGATVNGLEEAKINRELTTLIFHAAKKTDFHYEIAQDRNWYSYIKNGGSFNAQGYDYVLEIHCNSNETPELEGDGKIRGSMCYISQSESGHRVEDAILQKLYKIGSVKAWDGVVIAQRQWPDGLLVQEYIRSQGVSHAVLEIFFINDLDDVKWYQENKKQIAEAIVAGIAEGYRNESDTIQFEPYMIKITDPDLKIYSGPGMNYPITGQINDMGSYTIVEEAEGASIAKWGKLKSGAGWILLE